MEFLIIVLVFYLFWGMTIVRRIIKKPFPMGDARREENFKGTHAP